MKRLINKNVNTRIRATRSRSVMARCITSIALALAMLSAGAATIDSGTAQTRATQFLQSRSHGKLTAGTAKSLELVYTSLSKADQDQANYYVFNTSGNDAFVIVAGDDRAPLVLAWGDKGLDMTSLPTDMQWMLDRYDAQIEYLRTHPDATVTMPRQQQDTDVEPMLTCNWGQGTPYNNLCPVDNQTRCATGCGATAMAQAMYYWKYPSVLPALPSYTTTFMNFVMPELPSITLDWDNMLDDYLNVDYTDAQAQAVAQLMLYCGQACNMEYTAQASDARDLEFIRVAMMTFGYSGSIAIRDEYSQEQWDDMLTQEMVSHRPILYHAMQGPHSGHLFVIDGLDDGLYHINWGWQGNGNGFFAIDNFVVGNYAFTLDQKMLYQMAPNEDGAISQYDVEIDGIYYRIDGDQAIVVSKDSRFNSYQGDITIPDHITVSGNIIEVTAIGNSAFRNCTGLNSVTIGNAVKTIGKCAFYNATGLTQVTMGSQVATVGSYAFQGCSQLTAITMPSTLRQIQSSAFQGCTNLSKVVTSSPQLIIDSFAFYLCSSLNEVKFGDGDLTINDYVFYGCQALTRIIMGNGRTSIGQWAFSYCTSVTMVNLGDGDKELGYASFAYCSSLSRVNFGKGNISIDSYPFYGDNVTGVHISDIKSWCEASFKDQTSNPLNIAHKLYYNGKPVTDLIIGDDVEEISPYAFLGGNAISSVTLGKQVWRIGNMAFNGCSAINSVTCTSIDPPMLNYKGSFNAAIYNSATLYVPNSALADYQSTRYWSSFKTIEGIDMGGEPGDVNDDGKVDINDVTDLIDMMLSGTAPDAADIDGDGKVSIDDVTALIDRLLSGN